MRRRTFIKQAGQVALSGSLMSMMPSLSFADPQTVIINYYYKWEPISASEDQTQARGILINILNAVLKDRMGMNVQHNGLPWKRAQYEVENGQAHALCAFPSDARKEYLHFSKVPSLELNVVVFYNTLSAGAQQVIDAQAFDDFKGLVFGELSANDWAREVLKNHDMVEYVSDLESLVRVLDRGRVDLFMAPDLVGEYLVWKNGAQETIKQIAKPFINRKTPMHLGIRKDFPGVEELMARFDEEMAAFKASPDYNELIQAYLRG